MKKWIPVAALVLLAIACSKDEDREALQHEPQAIVTDTANDIRVEDEIKGSLD